MKEPTKNQPFMVHKIFTDFKKPTQIPFKGMNSRAELLTTAENSSNPTSQIELMPALVLGQVFATMPMYGVTSKKAQDLKFKWFDFRTLHTILVMIGMFIMVVVCLKWSLAKITLTSAPGLGMVIFYVKGFVGLLYFLWLARKWPALMVYWEKIENSLPSYSDPKQKISFSKIIGIMTFAITASRLLQHIGIISLWMLRVQYCRNSTNIESFFKITWKQVYSNDNYDGGIRGYFIEYLNIYCIIQSNYMEIFAIVISMCLANRFKRFNLHLERYKGMKMSSAFWIEQRLHFSNLTQLVAKVDQLISLMCSFALSLSLYSIIIQLSNCFQPQRTVFEAIYYWYRLLVATSKTFLVFWTASQINDESQKPAIILRSIPDGAYDSEAERFLEQVVKTKVGLTGLRFFYFTRPLMLSVVGTVLTFELVLVQFRMMFPRPDEDFCGNSDND